MRGPATSRIPQLDGVRGLAVVLVVAGHTSETVVPYGGAVGVVTFFVLSGHVITRQLLAEHDATGRMRLGAFWWRRAVRLLPAYAVVLAVVTVLVVVLGDPAARSHGRDLLVAATYVADYARALGDDLGLLGHTWSLAVEEQFYLLWPPVVIGVLALSRRPVLALGILGGVVVLAIAWRLVAAATMPYDWLAYSLDASAVALLVGALSAFVARCWPTAGRSTPTAVASGALVALVSLVVCTIPLGWGPAPGVTRWISTAAVAVAGCVVFLAARSRIRPLGLAPLRWLGTVSYGFYLWHFPLLALQPSGHAVTGPARILVVLLALGLATASWYLLERPLIDRFGRSPGARVSTGLVSVPPDR